MTNDEHKKKKCRDSAGLSPLGDWSSNVSDLFLNRTMSPMLVPNVPKFNQSNVETLALFVMVKPAGAQASAQRR